MGKLGKMTAFATVTFCIAYDYKECAYYMCVVNLMCVANLVFTCYVLNRRWCLCNLLFTVSLSLS